ncbi:hypothetical protein PR003_g14930 [Phytophthora rubi]|uniref:Uncharacterized protein n=1 Tax=Phytophthora rubi TaxID=129364 RepID=A0A6A3JR90_9STRA|nr:hypothetical protein PR001_g19613 [Phytophthora rubi]KAE9331595.1 hypothetical protein PR003_g14930 [Phytophthora rubi]
MTTETRIIVRPAPDALRAVGPTKPHADASAPSDMEEKPTAPASKKHSGDPEAAKDATKDADEAKEPPVPKKPKAAAAKAKAKQTPASPKATRRTKKVAASSKPTPKKAMVKKPATKQLPKKKGSSKEDPKTPKLPPKRTDVLRPGPHEEVTSDSSDTDTPNPGYVSGGHSPVADASQALRAQAPAKGPAASSNRAATSPQGRSPSPHPS